MTQMENYTRLVDLKKQYSESQAPPSFTRTTNPRQVENTTFQDTKANVVRKYLFINIFTPQMRHQSLSLLHINITNDFLYL